MEAEALVLAGASLPKTELIFLLLSDDAAFGFIFNDSLTFGWTFAGATFLDML